MTANRSIEEQTFRQLKELTGVLELLGPSQSLSSMTCHAVRGNAFTVLVRMLDDLRRFSERYR